MDGTAKTTGNFYRDDAARVALEAALRPAQIDSAAPQRDASYVPPVLLIEPQRPLLKPQPAINQNTPQPEDRREVAGDVQIDSDDDSRWDSAWRIVAWVVLAPWYLGVALAALGIDILFAKDLIGLLLSTRAG